MGVVDDERDFRPVTGRLAVVARHRDELVAVLGHDDHVLMLVDLGQLLGPTGRLSRDRRKKRRYMLSGDNRS